MERRSLHLSTGLFIFACAAFVSALADVSRGFGLLPFPAALALLAASALAFPFSIRSPSPHRAAASSLLLTAALSLGIRVLGYEPATRHDSEEWERALHSQAMALGERARAEFDALVSAAKARAVELARDRALHAAVLESSDVAVANAFSVLQEVESHSRTRSRRTTGVALFDREWRPVAWAGSSESLEWISSRRPWPSGADVSVVDAGTLRSIVASEPLEGGAGFVSVEVPLAADRRLENRYLKDFDAVSSAVGRSVGTRFASSSAEREAMSRAFETRGDPHWGTDSDTTRLHFRLRDPDGETLGSGTIALETVDATRLEYRRRFTLLASIALVAGAGLCLVTMAVGSPASAWLLLAVWGFRLVLRFTDVPLGLGLDLDNPAHYASSLFFGLARSPADFLVTGLALLASCRIIAEAAGRGRGIGIVPTAAWKALAAPAAVLLFVGIQRTVKDAWLNSNLPLSDVSFSPDNLSRLTVQLALLVLFASAVWLAYLGFAAASRERWSPLPAIAWDAMVVVGFLVALDADSRELVLLSALPLALVRVVSLGRDRVRAIFAHRRLHVRVPAAILFGVVGVLSFYPSVAYFESATIRGFIETTVSPVVLNHPRSRATTLFETARTIDRMFEQGQLGDMGREDLAFRIWVSTDLSVSSLSSAVEVVDPGRRVVSRFALSFPVVASEEGVAPSDKWLPEERTLPGDALHPGFVTARRSFESDDGGAWEIRVRLAADWRNLPFIATTDPYLRLFRSTAAETPLRFPHQELELIVLSPEGEMVFQSVGGSLAPDETLLKRARAAPIWWEHPHEGQTHRTYLVSDPDYVYTLSYPATSLLTYAAQLALWVILALAWGGVGVMLGLALGTMRLPFGIPPWELLHDVGASFSVKLYIAFVLIALVPIVLLAFLIRGIVVRELEGGVEREGIERAHLTARVVREVHFSQPTSAVGVAPLTDAVLERVKALAGVDVDIHVGGELLATSKPELVASGLVPTRAAPSAYRDIVLSRSSHSVHWESVGSFRYLVVSVPIVLPPWSQPGILSVPLASRQAEIDRNVASLNQAVLLAAVFFFLVAAALAYSLAHRIADPINQLTEATRSVAEGSLDVSLEPASRDEIGALTASFNRMTADLKRRREELERTKKLEAWAEMARQVAHEVKNPLTPIQLSTEHLLRVYGDDDVDFEKVLRDCSETILQQVRALRQISMEFSTFASPGPLNLEPTDVEALLRKTVEPYCKNPPEGVSVRLDVGPTGVPRTFADSRLLQRTFVNLIENALHALNGKGSITVQLTPRTRSGRATIEVTVSDNGVGIDPEVKSRVFEPYFSTRAAGTGLGLAIARKAVEDHGGEISLESELGKGTTVTLALPVLRSADAASTDSR